MCDMHMAVKALVPWTIRKCLILQGDEELVKKDDKCERLPSIKMIDVGSLLLVRDGHIRPLSQGL